MPIVMKRLAEPPKTGSTVRATLRVIDGIEESKPLIYRHGPSLRFVFELADTKYRGREATVITSKTLNDGSKLYSIASAILGHEPEDGEDVELALKQAVGKPFDVTIEHRPAADGNMVFLEAADIKPVAA